MGAHDLCAPSLFMLAPPVPIPPPPPPPTTSWFRRTLLEPVKGWLKQGLTPDQLARTLALGVACGLVPMPGMTTLLATTLAWRLRLNVAAMLLLGHLLTPLQVLLFVPFFRWGARVFHHSAAAALSLAQIKYQFMHPTAAGVDLLWRASLGALLLWAVAMVPLTFLLYRGLRPVLERLLVRLSKRKQESKMASTEGGVTSC